MASCAHGRGQKSLISVGRARSADGRMMPISNSKQSKKTRPLWVQCRLQAKPEPARARPEIKDFAQARRAPTPISSLNHHESFMSTKQHFFQFQQPSLAVECVRCSLKGPRVRVLKIFSKSQKNDGHKVKNIFILVASKRRICKILFKMMVLLYTNALI